MRGSGGIPSHNRQIWYFADNAAANRIFNWSYLVATAYCTQPWRTPRSLSASVSLVRVVAANLSLGTQSKAKPDHPSIFFGAKTAATFIQLNAELQVCFHLTGDGPCRRETKVIPLEANAKRMSAIGTKRT